MPLRRLRLAPPPIASTKYLCDVGEWRWRNVIPLFAVESVKVMGEGDCGEGAVGRRDGSPVP